MKHAFLNLCLALGLAAAGPVLYAQDPAAADAAKADSPAKKGDKKTEKKWNIPKKLSPVAEALVDLPYLTDTRPNLKAKQYKYIQSASWCGPCNGKMPGLVASYKALKKQGVEIIFLSADDSADKALAFLKKYNADFPVVLRSAPEVAKLPGHVHSPTLPGVRLVDKNGKLLDDGSPMRGRPN